MRIEIHHYIHQNGDDSQIIKLLRELKILNTELMSKTSAIEAKVDALQTALDEEQEQIRTAVGELESLRTEVQSLRDQLAQQGADNEALDRIDVKLGSITEDLKSTIPDEPTEPTEPTEPQA